VSARQRAARQQFEVTEFEAAFDGIWFVAHPEIMTISMVYWKCPPGRRSLS
jgi:hypothetical protein